MSAERLSDPGAVAPSATNTVLKPATKLRATSKMRGRVVVPPDSRNCRSKSRPYRRDKAAPAAARKARQTTRARPRRPRQY